MQLHFVIIFNIIDNTLNISGKKLKVALRSAEITQQEAADKLGIARQTLSQWLKHELLSEEILQNVKSILEIDLKKDITGIVVPEENITKTSNFVTKSKSLIPFYNADFMAGKSEAFYDDGSTHPDYYMDVPEFYGCVAFRAYGESMEPIIKSGNVLFGLKLDEWQISLEYGQIYGITMKDGRRVLKYIRRASDHKNMFLLKSANKDFDDYEELKSKIKNIWLIQGWLDKRA